MNDSTEDTGSIGLQWCRVNGIRLDAETRQAILTCEAHGLRFFTDFGFANAVDVARREATKSHRKYCLCCGYPKTIVPGRPVMTRTEDGMVNASRLLCLRCGSGKFTDREHMAPRFPAGVFWTTLDKRLMKTLGIAV